jgi:C4-dicarboxylate-specific signal transduction histidine kinase
MPTAVFILGLISVVMIFWIHSIRERQRMAFEHVDDIMDIQVRAATFHLWFEEAITKGAREDMEKSFADLEQAIKFSDALLFGGEAENGTILLPFDDPAFLDLARSIRLNLDSLNRIALQRARDPERGGIGSALDDRFNVVFNEFQTSARQLEIAVEKDRSSDQAETKRLFFITLFIWALIVTGSIAGLYHRELGRRRAEQSLEEAYAEMEQRVQERTAEMVELQAEALRAAHLASLGELSAGVAHEINNPINGIINYARILSNKSARGSAENDVAERIAKEGRRIAGIVKSLLSFARDSKEGKKPVRLESILRESLTLTESQMRKEGVQLRVDLPAGLPEITANQQQIQQVFMNIINNAQYALKQKFPGEHEDKVLHIIGEVVTTDKGPFVRVTFHDRGTGIAPGALCKIMNPFFSTKPRGEGTGLGLSISHGIVTDHGGRLAVRSVQGEHTEVQIDLPAAG